MTMLLICANITDRILNVFAVGFPLQLLGVLRVTSFGLVGIFVDSHHQKALKA